MILRARCKILLAVILLVAGVLLLPRAAWAAPEPTSGMPRLIVVVVIDQFRADYLERFRERFGPDGFNRLLREGAYFTSCFYPYARTNTAPGHASLATGTTPDRHGIANNSWYDFDQGRRVAAVFDEASPLVGTETELSGVSPRSLKGSTLADQLRFATEGKAKVFGVGIKDRAAIFSTGHAASGAYWYDYETGRFITSRYYRDKLPAWVAAFNQRRPADRYYGKDWAAGGKVFLSLSTESGHPDARFYRRLPFTPYGNELVLAFARELVEQEGLGEDAVPDFLALGFSANDFVGHRWGPYSEEVAEITLRTDEQVAELLAFLDERVGAGNYWLALSADHGVAPTLAQARARGLPAQSVAPGALLEAVRKAFAEQWGEDEWLVPRAGLVFNRETLKKHGVGVDEAAHRAGEVSLGFDGVRGYVTSEETRLDPKFTEAVRRSIYPGRVPDVYVVLEPFAIAGGEGRVGTVHGSPYAYDTHVPLILFGAAFRPGVYPEQVSPTDLAPTLAAALRINPPALASGTVLVQALRVE